MGENGAGKSTLMKIVAGMLQADSGEMSWQGRPARFHNPAEGAANCEKLSAGFHGIRLTCVIIPRTRCASSSASGSLSFTPARSRYSSVTRRPVRAV